MTDVPEGFSTPGTATAPVSIRQTVSWGEMDSLGHVNNAVYLRYLENVRFAYFDAVGLNQWLVEHGQGPILARLEIDFKAPVTFPDTLWLSCRVVRLGTKSFTLRNRIWSSALAADAAVADAVIVTVDYAGAGGTIAVPATVRAAIEALDGPFPTPGHGEAS